MTKTEYITAIAAEQTAVSNLRTDLRRLRTIEKLARSFPDLTVLPQRKPRGRKLVLHLARSKSRRPKRGQGSPGRLSLLKHPGIIPPLDNTLWIS